MTFVYPLLLGGLLLAGLPVLLHFLVRKKPTTLLFPAFRFLMQKQRSNTRNLRLKHLLLLLLRIALIVLVCLALARPRLFQESLGISREKPVAMVLVFDTSPSMGYKSGEVTRLDFAKKRALDLLDPLPEDCRVLILDACDPATFAREVWQKSLDKARQRIQSLTIRQTNEPVSAAVDEAMRRFDAWDDPEALTLPRFVCVFSDRTRASWVFSANAKRPAKEDAIKLQTLFFDVGIDDPVDIAITHVELPRDYRGEMRQSFTAGAKIELRAVVKATGKTAEGTLICKVGNESLKQAFNVEAGTQQTLMFLIDSEASKLKPGLHQAEIKLDTDTDALPFNNQRFVTFQIRDKPRVLVLADDLKATQKFAQWLDALLYAVDHKNVAEKNITYGNYQAIFLIGVVRPEETLWKELGDYVKQGRGLAVIPPGDELQQTAYNAKAAQDLLPGRVVGKVAADKKGQWDLDGNDLQHPFLLPIRAWRERGFFLRYPRSAHFYWQVNDKKPGIVNYEDGNPAVLESVKANPGKVLLLTTPMDSRASEWNNYDASHTWFYPALTMMCAKHLVADVENPALNFQFGGVLPRFKKSPVVFFPKYFLTVGDLSEETRFDENNWVGERLAKPGNYALSGRIPEKDETTVLWRFSVNTPSEESDLTRIAKEEVEAVLGPEALVPLERNTPLLDSIGHLWSEPVELFPWLMIALLFFLAFENLLANKFYRQETP